MTEKERMWVNPAFKKLLQKQAIDNDKSLLELTKELAKLGDPLNAFKKKKSNKFGFQFP